MEKNGLYDLEKKGLICPGCKQTIGLFNEITVKQMQGFTWHPKCKELHDNIKNRIEQIEDVDEVDCIVYDLMNIIRPHLDKDRQTIKENEGHNNIKKEILVFLKEKWFESLEHHDKGNYVNLHDYAHWEGILEFWKIKKALEDISDSHICVICEKVIPKGEGIKTLQNEKTKRICDCCSSIIQDLTSENKPCLKEQETDPRSCNECKWFKEDFSHPICKICKRTYLKDQFKPKEQSNNLQILYPCRYYNDGFCKLYKGDCYDYEDCDGMQIYKKEQEENK